MDNMRLEVLKELNKLQDADYSWMDTPVKMEAFRDAYAFASVLPDKMIGLPIVSVVEDGEINFAWGDYGGDCGEYDVNVDLGFYGDGTYSFYVCDGRKGKLYGDDLPPGEIPDGLNLLLTTGCIDGGK